MKQNYIGQVVILTKLTPNNNDVEFDSGEYIVVNQSNGILFCIITGTPYEMTRVHKFKIEGPVAWNVDARGYNADLISNMIDDLYEFMDEKTKSGAAWCNSVYEA